MQKHFVEFYSPGSFVAETSTKPIEAWDVDTAMIMARGIKERYGATPYAFKFLTRSRGDNDLDSKVSEKSPMYFLGGKVFTVEQLEKRNREDERILLSNMKSNGYDRVVVNENSWRWTQPLNHDDVVLEWKP